MEKPYAISYTRRIYITDPDFYYLVKFVGEKRTFDRWVHPKQKDMITEFAELHGIEVLIRLEPCVLVKTEDDAVLIYLAFA